MSIPIVDLRDFPHFAAAKRSRGPAESLVVLAGEWEAKRRRAELQEADETLADIRASHADIEAGRVVPLSDAFQQVREQLGLKRPTGSRSRRAQVLPLRGRFCRVDVRAAL